MGLEFVEPKLETPLNVLLYGPPGTGKTVGATSAPGPVLLVNADQPNRSRFAHRMPGREIHEVRFEGMKTLSDVIFHLQDTPAERTVVIDTVGEAHRLMLEDLSKRAIRPSLPLYGDVSVQLERWCRRLCELPVNVVLVAHEALIENEQDGTVERLPYTGTNKPKLAGKLMSMVDVVGYCGVAREDGKPARYLAQLVDGNGRRGKDGDGALGELRALDLTEWSERTSAALAPAKQQKGNG